MFEKEIKEYERIRKEYQQKIADRMGKEQWMDSHRWHRRAPHCLLLQNCHLSHEVRTLLKAQELIAYDVLLITGVLIAVVIALFLHQLCRECCRCCEDNEYHYGQI